MRRMQERYEKSARKIYERGKTDKTGKESGERREGRERSGWRVGVGAGVGEGNIVLGAAHAAPVADAAMDVGGDVLAYGYEKYARSQGEGAERIPKGIVLVVDCGEFDIYARAVGAREECLVEGLLFVVRSGIVDVDLHIGHAVGRGDDAQRAEEILLSVHISGEDEVVGAGRCTVEVAGDTQAVAGLLSGANGVESRAGRNGGLGSGVEIAVLRGEIVGLALLAFDIHGGVGVGRHVVVVDSPRENDGGVAVADSNFAEGYEVVLDEVFDTVVGGVDLTIRATAVNHHHGVFACLYPPFDNDVGCRGLVVPATP